VLNILLLLSFALLLVYNGAGPLPREGVLSVIDVQKFSKEVVDEVKTRFPERFSEDAEIASSLLSLIAVVAATAIAKYEKERS
jgi:hypothetical protein